MERKKQLFVVMMLMAMLICVNATTLPVFAAGTGTDGNTAIEEVQNVEEEEADSNVLSSKAMAAALVVGIVGAAGAIGMAIAIAKSTEGMARQPEAAGKINSAMMLGLVFIETAIIYALIIAILIIFVL